MIDLKENKKREFKLIEYTEKELINFKNGKVKNVKDNKDIISFIKKSKISSSNAKLYFGKIGEILANKIKISTGIDLYNYNISLKADSVRHILNKHSSNKELLRGQIPVNVFDFELIPKIITSYDHIRISGRTKYNKAVLTFVKQIDNNYYLVNYVSDKSHNLEVQTMWKQKKNSATAENALSPIQTSETNSGTSSSTNNSITIKS